MDELAYAQPTGKVSSEGQITRELVRQLNTLEELHQVIGALEIRTADVRMGKPEPGDTRSPDRPEPLRATLANEIAQRTDAVENATRRLQVLLNELEL